jgi:hypothetical protein
MALLDTASLIVTPNGYKASKLYSIVPSDGTGDMTFARTGDTATRVNSSGLIETVLANKPRLDYTSSTCPKLLLEPQRTNLLLNSADFTGLTLTGVTIGSNVAISPDGTSNADSLIEDTTTNHAAYNFSATTYTAVPYTFSVFLKKGGRDWGRIAIYDNGISAKNAYFNLSNGVIGTVESGATATMTNYGNGWYRCTITRTMSAQVGGFAVYASSGDNVASYTGTSGLTALYAYGTQLEAGTYATSYIPTTTASVTRNADFCNKTGISALLNASQGTYVFKYQNIKPSTAGSTVAFEISNGTDTSKIGLYFNVTAGRIRIRITSSSGISEVEATTFTTTDLLTICVRYSSSDLKMWINGTLIGTTTSPQIMTALNQISFAQWWGGTSAEGKFEKLAYWKTALTDTECITLSQS